MRPLSPSPPALAGAILLLVLHAPSAVARQPTVAEAGQFTAAVARQPNAAVDRERTVAVARQPTALEARQPTAVEARQPTVAEARVAAALPRVHVIATGGTIASRAGENLRAGDLVDAVPGLDGVARITTEQFSNVGSSQIGPDHWLRLSRRIGELFRDDPELAGVVVTHGTDTMEETALFLDLTLSDPRPVVLTGSMRPPRAVGPEGAANLLDAVRVAVAPEARGRGALVVMNDEIFAAVDVTKTNTSRLDAFRAPGAGPVGVADPDRVVFHRAPPRRPRPAFEVGDLDGLPAVGVVYSYGGADGTAVDAFVEAGVRGLVLATVGRGNLPAAQREAARRAAERGVVVVLSSRTGGGRIPAGPIPAGREGDVLFVGAGRLNPQKARVLLVLALTRSGAPERVAAAFEELEG